jgi:hypothetical protein
MEDKDRREEVSITEYLKGKIKNNLGVLVVG